MRLYIFRRSTGGAYIADSEYLLVIASTLKDAWSFLDESESLKLEYLQLAFELDEEIQIAPGIIRKLGH